MTDEILRPPPPPPRKKGNYVGAPMIFALELALQPVCEAFGGWVYLVGSALERPDWRDVDLRLIMKDDAFYALFPNADRAAGHYQHDQRWLLMNIAVSAYLRGATNLPVDFQFQPRDHANEWHNGQRHPMGRRWVERFEE